jgi:hypothetical protein
LPLPRGKSDAFVLLSSSTYNFTDSLLVGSMGVRKERRRGDLSAGGKE